MPPSRSELLGASCWKYLKIRTTGPFRVAQARLDGPVKVPVSCRHRFRKARMKGRPDLRILTPAHRRCRGSERPERPRRNAVNFSKKAIDGAETPPYMALHRRGTALAEPVCVSLYRLPVARFSPGRETCRLFDIVGLDEGTCGRRPRSPAASRRWMIGQTKPFQMSSYISTVICICAGTAPRDTGLATDYSSVVKSYINLRV